MLRNWYVRLVLALGSGAFHALAYPNYNLPWLAWIAIALLLLAVVGARPSYALLVGFLHGAVFVVMTMPWIFTVMHVQGGIATLPAFGTMAAFTFYLALYPAAFAFAMAIRSRVSIRSACLFAPLVWALLEYLQTQMWYIGFPWNLLGYPASQNLGLLQLTSLTGIWGLSFLVAAFNALIVWALLAAPSERRKAWPMLGVAALALFGIAVIGPHLVPKSVAKHQARLVQMNFPETMSYPPDWMALHVRDMDELEKLSIADGTRPSDLIVWPEVPAPFSMGDPEFMRRARHIAQAAHTDFLFGVVDWHPAEAGGPSLPHNSAALFHTAPGGDVTYDKIHLVPFGEYVPLRRWLTFAEKLTADIGDFTPGTVRRVGHLANGGSEGTVICFEAIFPELVRGFTDRGAQLLINISNDGWVDATAAPAQHVMMARVRAVENRRWLLRATNTGQTVSVDPYGRITARLEPDVRGVLRAEYDFRSDKTLYTRAGDWFVWLCVLALLAAEISRARRKNPRTSPQTNTTTKARR